MGRRAAIVFGLLATIIVAVLVLQPSRPRPRPGLATFNQVRVGMTLEEVIATVGKPPDTTFKRTEWEADDATLEVRFGQDGRARQVLVEPKAPARTH
jgi:hypothetical protein